MKRSCVLSKNTTLFLVEEKLVQILWKKICLFLRNLKSNLPQDSAISIWAYTQGIPHPITITSYCSPMITEIVFIIARDWKQPRYLSTQECMKKTWYFYTLEYYSALETQWLHEMCSQNLELGKNHSGWGVKDPERQTRYVLTCKWILAVKVKSNHDTIYRPRGLVTKRA